MKAEDVPQEEWIKGHGKRACYAQDENGRYVVVPSKGWEVEKIVNSQAHEIIDGRIEETRLAVIAGQVSPLKYHMECNQMDVALLASTIGFWRWQVKRHLKPKHFTALEKETLEKYAQVLRVSVEELKKVPSS